MINCSDLKIGDFRLREVDNKIHLPININCKLLCTSNDVIHSFAIPSIGIKIDCIPGRINQSFINVNRPSIYTGGCSEICGTEHSFMPIVIKICSNTMFAN
tara:strand:+ start:88 stop:390 length:303 start_codon:yes stop_codon:yes gene_type:complete